MTSRSTSRPSTRTRAAFTLPELLVVVTVTLVLMSILVQASTIITNTVSAAKAQGDFVGQERAAIALMRRDLQFNHFLEEDTKPNLGLRLSDQFTNLAKFDNVTTPTRIIDYKPPRSGYFWASAKGIDNASNFDEGLDASGFGSSRSGNHFMQFTIVVPGGAPQNTLTVDIPTGTTNVITGTCAEVAYFLVGNGLTPGGVPQYKLIRRQRLAARNTDDDPAYGSLVTQLVNQSGAQQTDPPEVVACQYNSGTSAFDVFNLNELTVRSNRVAQQPITTHRIGEDVLHYHVTSFELKFTGPQVTGVSFMGNTATVWPRPFTAGNTDYPYDMLPFDGEYDTGDESLVSNPANLATTSSTGGRIKPIRITGVQIRLRCWNPRNKQTRQTTTIVEL